MAERVLITGAGGFIGSHVMEEFAAADYRLRVTDLAAADLTLARQLGAEVMPGDLLDEELMHRAVEGCGIVVHVAAIFDFSIPRKLMERVNVEGVRIICRAALDAGIKRMVYFSSTGVYGKPRVYPVPEEGEKHPRNVYEETKWRGEQVAISYHREHGLPVTALRPTLVYGPRSRYGHAPYIGIYAMFAAAGRRALPILDRGPATHHVHVKDVARAALLLARHPDAVGRAFNLADETPLSLEETMTAMMVGTGLRPARRRIPYWRRIWRFLLWLLKVVPDWLVLRPLNRRLERDWPRVCRKFGLTNALQPRLDKAWLDYVGDDHYYDTSRIKALGFTFRYPRFTEGMREVIQWYRDQRWIPPPKPRPSTPSESTEGSSNTQER